jgi:hypothetical protein
MNPTGALSHHRASHRGTAHVGSARLARPRLVQPCREAKQHSWGIELAISRFALSRPPWLMTMTDNAPYGPALRFTLPVGGTRVL